MASSKIDRYDDCMVFLQSSAFHFLEFSLAALRLHTGYIRGIARGIKLSKFQNSDPTATDSKVLNCDNLASMKQLTKTNAKSASVKMILQA